jgi:hypothetical protein
MTEPRELLPPVDDDAAHWESPSFTMIEMNAEIGAYHGEATAAF